MARQGKYLLLQMERCSELHAPGADAPGRTAPLSATIDGHDCWTAGATAHRWKVVSRQHVNSKGYSNGFGCTFGKRTIRWAKSLSSNAAYLPTLEEDLEA